MRLVSLTLRHYRIHEHVTVEFDPARTLIGGRNETGKSTLVEAAHRALFLKARTGGSLQRKMVSLAHHGDPEVTLAFEAEGKRWILSKRFAGPRGSTLLTAEGTGALRDEAAESKMDELLKATSAGGRSAPGVLPDLWSHLWVWQGRSSEDPALHTGPHKAALVQHLQQIGASTLLQSANDERISRHFAEAYDTFFTAFGRPKAGSSPELARARLEEAEATLAKTREAAERLAQAADDHTRAESTILELNALIPKLRAEHSDALRRKQHADSLQRSLETLNAALQSAKSRVQECVGYDATIRSLESDLANHRSALQPAEDTLAALAAEEAGAQNACLTAESDQRASSEALRTARHHHDLSLAALAAIEKSAVLQTLAARAAEATSLRERLNATRTQAAGLPEIDSKDLARLRALDSEATRAAAALAAMATGLEIICSDTRIQLDGSTVQAGDTHILTNPAEVHVGSGTRFRIQPGGGQSLDAARRHAESSHASLALALERLALPTTADAAAVHEQRLALESRIAALEGHWSALGGADLDRHHAAARVDAEAAIQEVKRRAKLLSQPAELPVDIESARTQATEARTALVEAEAAEEAARIKAELLRAKHQNASAALATHRDALAAARLGVRDIETAIRTREQTHGDAAARAAALAAAAEAQDIAEKNLAATQTSLDSLNPGLIASDIGRLERALNTQAEKLREAENTRLLARDRLTLDGSIDPESDLRHAEAAHAAARHRHATEHRRARAIETIHQLFTNSRAAIDRALVQPLADRISGYLQCLFGPGTTARVQLTDAGIEHLELSRPGDPAFSFSSLSVGAREQTAAAVRLAVAEILAIHHDGCLPVVFDDAFAHSDPERIQSLQRMLDLAATRGLQVIVLTCTPAAYAGFGAREVLLGSTP